MTQIIAEIAQGYEGNPKLAELLTKAAIRANADAIKFQLVFADELATPDYEYYSLFKNLEMDFQVWSKITETIHHSNKKVFFDIFGAESFAWAKKLNADGVKFSTTEFYNEHLIRKALEEFDEIIISIGGIPIKDINWLIENVVGENQQKVCFLYGFQSEPTPLEQNNLRKLSSYKEKFPQFEFGFMDHSEGGSEDAFYLSIMALSLEIKYIEKHITLDRILEIEDYVSALEPTNFTKFVQLIKKFAFALGSSSLELSSLEKEYKKRAGKVVVAKIPIPLGKKMGFNDLTLKRVGAQSNIEGFNKINEVVGKTSSKPFDLNDVIGVLNIE